MDDHAQMDNISFNSDDTDYILSKDPYGEIVIPNDKYNKVDVSDIHIRTQSYIDAILQDNYVSPINDNYVSPKNSDNQSNSFYNKENEVSQNLSKSSLKSLSYNKSSGKSFNSNSSFSKSPGGKHVSFEHELSNNAADEFTDLQAYATENYNTSLSSIKEQAFDDIDEKVKEGQEIIKKLLSETIGDKDPMYNSLQHAAGIYSTSRTTTTKSSLYSSKDKQIKYSPRSSLSPKNTNINQNIETANVLQGRILPNPSNDSYQLFPENKNTSLSYLVPKTYTEQSTSGYISKSPLRQQKSPGKENLNPEFLKTSNEILRNTNKVQKNLLDSFEDKSIATDEWNVYTSENSRLQDEILFIEESNKQRINIIQQEHDQKVSGLTSNIDILEKQKANLVEHINQLKESLSRKNKRCLEYQETIHDKTKQISKLSTTDDLERQNLQIEIISLQAREKDLDKQVNSMQKAFDKQHHEIKELEERIEQGKQFNQSLIKQKERRFYP